MVPADPALLNHIEIEFGDHGRRAVEFLRTAADLLAVAAAAQTPRLAEAIAYCLREAMKTIPASHEVEQGGQWRTVSRAVADARRRYELVRGIPGEDAEGALRELLLAIDGFEQIHGQEGIHQRRLIAIMVSRAGAPPLSAGTEPVRRYQDLLEELDSALHNSATIDAVLLLWDRCIKTLRQLFLPPDLRHEELAALAGNPAPGSAEVGEVLTLLAGSNHLQYFLEHASGPAWLEALTESGILDPPQDNGPWPVFAAIDRFAPTFGAKVVDWLQRMYDRHPSDPNKRWFIARAAVELGPDALPIVLQALREHDPSPALAHLGVWSVERAAPESELVESFADLLLNRQAWQNAGYAAPVLEQLLAGLNRENSLRRIQLLCWKLRAVDEDEGSRRWFNYDRAGSIVDWRDDDPDDRLGSLLRALIAALTRAWEWITVDDALSVVDSLPDEIRDRVRSWVLASAPASDPTAMIEEIAGAIATRDPTGEDLALIDRVVASTDPSNFERQWTDALGLPPGVAEVAQALAKHELPVSVRRSFHWSGILPEHVNVSWSQVASVIAAVYGRPSRQALQKRSRVEAAWGRSPISAEDLGALSPVEAAQTVAAWRPNGAQFLVSARELARAIEQVAKASPQDWLAEPLVIATELRHPTYIHHYLTAVADAIKNGADPAVGELLDVIGLVRAHPWPAEALGRDDFDYDDGWDPAVQAGVDVAKAIADRDLGFAGRNDEVWAMLETEVRDRSQPSGILSGARDPLDHAINRRCTRALDAVLSFMAHEFRTTDGVRPEALTLIEEVLRLDGADGAEHRAILATRLGFLRHVAPCWFDASSSLFLGADAPGDLAQVTADLALKWGRPNRWLHEQHRNRVRDAVRRDVENAIDHLLIAMLWGVPGYTIEDNIAFLHASPAALSKAGEALGRLLRYQDADPAHVAVAADFWRAAVDAGVNGELVGFGWMAEVEQLDDATWAELAQKTLVRTAGKIDWARKVAERAASLTPSATTLSIMNLLVRGISDEWERRGTAELAVGVLNRAGGLAETPEYERLRTTLLERGAM